MGVATRDFIPTDDTMTAHERAAASRGRMIRTGANHQDYIPDPTDTRVIKPKLTPDQKADRAMEYANQRALAGEKMEWDAAIVRLQNWSPAQAVDAMVGMPFRVMEMYITCEMAHGARRDVLSVFPLPDPRVVEQFAPQLLAEVEAYSTTAPDPEPEPEPEPTSILGTADLADAAPVTVTPDETFMCIDCGQIAKTLAGLKAHERAKHGIGEADDVSIPQAGE